MRAPYISLYEYDRRCHYNSVYEYEQKLVSDKDNETKRKLIWGHVGKNVVKSPLVQEFNRKTISAHKPVQEPLPIPTPLAPTLHTPIPSASTPPAPASAGQKSKSNLPNKQEHPALVAKNLECQAPNPDISYKKV